MKLSKIKIIKLDVYKNSKGDLIKYLNCQNKYFKKFGETYFTEIKKIIQRVGIITKDCNAY